MEAFTRFKAIGIPIDIANCDTDQIIPARFLRYSKKDPNYSQFLFHDLRFEDDGAERDTFIFNRSPYREGKIIVADVNWGCGSSREHAVDALVANGIRCVIAPSFGDIHFNNCMKHGVLPVRLDEATCERLRSALHTTPGAEIEVDLNALTVKGPGNFNERFELGAFDRLRMLKGLDDIGITEEHLETIQAYEKTHFEEYDWLSR